MTSWQQASEIYALAAELGISDRAPASGIVDYCRRRIDAWVAKAGGISNIDDLESLVATKLQMVFEEIKTDDDWVRLKEVYAKGKKEFVFGALRTKFDDGDNITYGALVQRRNASAVDLDRYVAVIDCRGTKGARRFFTRWHEIAHRLTTHADMPEPVFRSEHDPIERMMDEIAGHIGFYEPLLAPAFQQALSGQRHLKFEAVEAIINDAFPTASFQATLFACTRRFSTPVVYVEATLDHKKEVKRKLATKSLFEEDPPPGELRAVKVIPNETAKQNGFTIPTNMRVPADSIIHHLFEADSQTCGEVQENLSSWQSQGRSLKPRAVIVQAKKTFDRVIAIVQPLLVTDQKKVRCEAPMTELFNFDPK